MSNSLRTFAMKQASPLTGANEPCGDAVGSQRCVGGEP